MCGAASNRLLLAPIARNENVAFNRRYRHKPAARTRPTSQHPPTVASAPKDVKRSAGAIMLTSRCVPMLSKSAKESVIRSKKFPRMMSSDSPPMTSKSPFTLRSEFNAFVMPVMGSTTLKKVKLEKVTGKSYRKKLPEKDFPIEDCLVQGFLNKLPERD